MTAVEVRGVTKVYRGGVTALDAVSFDLHDNAVHGLLGRNGAGKTTLLRILTSQVFATSGSVEVFGADPRENARVRQQVCFVGESQTYPSSFAVHHVLRAGALLYPTWDDAYAHQLAADFGLPQRRGVGRLSRGMHSALGIVVGIASRAPLTVFDEPSLGLDAVARQLWHERLLADYVEHPRTVVLSTHLIDEVAGLLERVIVLDRGRVLLDDDAEALRARAVVVSGPAQAVRAFVDRRDELHRERLGGYLRVTVRGPLDATDHARAHGEGLGVEPVSLQQLFVLEAVAGSAEQGAAVAVSS